MSVLRSFYYLHRHLHGCFAMNEIYEASAHSIYQSHQIYVGKWMDV